jgi:hypothetical protein
MKRNTIIIRVTHTFTVITPMEMTLNMELLERRYGKPLRNVILELYPQLGSRGAVAETLGISRQAFNAWCIRLGLQPEDFRQARLAAAR